MIHPAAKYHGARTLGSLPDVMLLNVFASHLQKESGHRDGCDQGMIVDRENASRLRVRDQSFDVVRTPRPTTMSIFG